ncbi:tetratricopeptide TPR_2 [Candidatus Scalindua japonica]|uniref:Tetratricopeptide TPR_2 n=1 Tax=Candidatus Scalindua japonica TaxID=1284222 RepID=A0A286TZK2_9BACT|nr:tetratricopeptide repeat protein [Candidatus Scalindua japonica]GAX61304.1 tetratricopeptide TPR_2 [Candidatus Scalindua japonica]
MHLPDWIQKIPVSAKGIISAPLSLFSRRSSKGLQTEDGYKDNENDKNIETYDLTLINTEELAEKLSRHLPEQLSSHEKKAEMQELENTIKRLQQSNSDEYKHKVLRELSKGKITEAADILNKTTQHLMTSSMQPPKQPSKKTALDWIDVGNIMLLKGPHKSLTAFRKAVKMDNLNTEAWHRLGRVSYWTGNLKESRQAYEQILELEGKDEPLKAMSYSNLGTIYKKSGQLDKAEESYLESLEISETLDLQEEMAFANGNLGIIYYTRGEYDKAEEFYQKSLEINKTLNQQEGMATQYCNLGIIYKKRGDVDKAKQFYQKSLEINKSIGQKRGIASGYGNLGNIYKIRGELDKAEEFHLKSLEINKSLAQKRGMATDYGNLGNVYKIRGKLNKACNYWEKSLELFSNLKAEEQVNLTKKLIAENGKTDK